MNQPLRRIAVVVMIMFAMLLANASYTYLFRHDMLHNDPNNRRVRNEQFAQDRGPIMVGSAAIAESKPVNDKLKFQRTYPDGPTYAAITGYFSFDFAASGLERTYNDELAGLSDSLAMRRALDRLTGKQPKGATVETTLDSRLQKAAAKALQGSRGAIVALDTRTGAVKALVSAPSWDPNDLATHDLAAANEAWQKLNTDETRPMVNRATREFYPPGSTFKVVVSAAALEAGRTPESMVESPHTITLPGTKTVLPNQSAACNGKITFTRALSNSCNTTFALLGMELGEQRLADQARKFGFGQRPLPELRAIASQFPSQLEKPQLAQSSIGQFDVRATPLQMAMVAQAIGNDGILMEPYLVQTVRAPDLSVISEHKPRELARAVSPQTAESLRTMMKAVVERGSGRRAAVPGLTVMGKTGKIGRAHV